MAIAMQRFCINRKIAPALSIEAFFRLVNRLGLNKVELRNDLPSGKVTDDLSHQQVRELAARYHIEILTINAVYPFNRRSEEVRQLTESLLKEARPSAPNRWCSVRSTTAARCRPAKPWAPCATWRRCSPSMASTARWSRWASRKARCVLRTRRRR